LIAYVKISLSKAQTGNKKNKQVYVIDDEGVNVTLLHFSSVTFFFCSCGSGGDGGGDDGGDDGDGGDGGEAEG
jgi:hypothetical protein